MGAEAQLKALLVGKVGKREARRYERYISSLAKAGYSDADSLKSVTEDELIKFGLPSYLAEKLAGGPRRSNYTLVLKFMILPAVLGFGIMAVLVHLLTTFIPGSPVTMFLNAPLLKDLPDFSPDYQNEMLWGTYRSGHYLGLRTRQPLPMSVGLMWFDPDDASSVQKGKLRHEAQQGDELSTHGWLQHDGRSFGEQRLVDDGYNITLHWVKSISPSSGPGGDWALKVQVSPTNDFNGIRPKRIALLFYLIDHDRPQDEWILFPEGTEKMADARDGGFLIAGNSHTLGHWALHLETSVHAPLYYAALELPGSFHPHRIQDVVMHQIGENARKEQSLSDLHIQDVWGPAPNASLFQVSMEVGGSAELVFLTNLEDSGEERLSELKGTSLTYEINKRKKAFKSFVDEQFLGQAGENLGTSTKEMVAAALSNLMGSMGYFYGYSLVELPGAIKKVKQYGPCALYTCVPSRSFFPRGFLWDEGFHQLLLQRLSPKLSRDVLAHWLDLMNSEGWIPREQILGEEARARVPEEYIVQQPTHANPPSLFLPLAHMAETLEDSDMVSPEEAEANRKFLLMAWPRLETWFGWYNRTQQGPLEFTYRWHGRNSTTNLEMNPRTLMSGFDDYPRASHPSEMEMHLDLRCWLALAARTMTTIGSALNLPKQMVLPYRELTAVLSDIKNLNRLHQDKRTGMYLDFGNHTEKLYMQNVTTFGADGMAQSSLVRVVDEPPELQLVPNFGYVSLFPLLMQLLPADSPELSTQLKLLSDTTLLYSPFGLRSLSTRSKYYRKYNTESDPPYWRGPVWININYLALRALHHYCHKEGPSRARACELHKELRELVLGNVVRQYKKTGYLWEQYDDLTGEGKGCRPFTGWTALVAMIAAEAY